MGKTTKPAATVKIEDVSFKDALGERYLAYALSTITSRSLPDVRDGLKPVHRRLLYAMLQLKLDPKSGFKKCARVVGDVIGKYHPHGDSAVYDTMVRLAQGFALRYPLVEGQGNFGSIDGDNAAAMRYTEARLTDVAMALMEDISSDTVDFRATYDGEDSEPVVMPAGFPNLLANGSEGIAVGMATAIPPHNIIELCNALVHLIKTPNTSVETLCKHVTGPDFPTGGLVVESRATIQKIYETGRGGMRVRARWEKEELSHGLYQIVITEIPYQVQKSRLIEKMAELFREKKLPLLGGIRDESTDEIRLILEPKTRSVDPEMLMALLFKTTDLEIRYSMNLNVLSADSVPRVMSLKGALQSYIDHRHVVLVRKTQFRLEQIARRMEMLEALLACYANLDEVIRIIREEDEPKPILMEFLELNDVQVDAILNMRLRQLRKLEEAILKKEYAALKKERKELNALLKDEPLRMQVLADQIKALKKHFASDKALSARRTEMADAPILADVDVTALIEKEPVTIICSKLGWTRAFKGHHESMGEVKFKEGDGPAFEVPAQTTDKLLVFASDGRFYTIGCDKFPGAKGQGEPIRLMIDLDNKEDIISMFIYRPGAQYLVISSAGKGFLVSSDDLVAQTRNGKQVLSLANKVSASACIEIQEGDDHIAVIGTSRKMLVFPIDQLPSMKRGQGVALQKYKGATFSDAKAFSFASGLSWKSGERTRQEDDMTPWLSNRATQGKLPPAGFPRSNLFK